MAQRSDIIILVIGLGIEVIVTILGIVMNTIPVPIVIAGLVVGGAMILWGIMTLLGFNFRWPITRHRQVSLPRFDEQIRPTTDDESPNNQSDIPCELRLTNQQPLLLDGFEFFPSRDSLRLIHPMTTFLREPKAIWAMWHTGTQAWSDGIINRCEIQRLILPDPESPYAKMMADAFTNGNVAVIKQHIRALTKQAREKRLQQDEKGEPVERKRIEVSWYKGLVGDTITIGFWPADEKKDWILMETIVASTQAPERPSFLVKREPYSSLFNTLYKTYEDIWSKSDPVLLNPEQLDESGD